MFDFAYFKPSILTSLFPSGRNFECDIFLSLKFCVYIRRLGVNAAQWMRLQNIYAFGIFPSFVLQTGRNRGEVQEQGESS